MKRALILAFVSTSAIASSNYTQDARQLASSALCGESNTACQQSEVPRDGDDQRRNQGADP